jgi:ABC-type transport system substrate-binding protein
LGGGLAYIEGGRKMRKKEEFNKGKLFLAIALVGIMCCATFSAVNLAVAEQPKTRADLILKVAMQDDMKTRNILGSGDVWTSNVLWPCFDGVMNEDPETDELVPYVAQCSGDQHGVLFGCDEWPKGSGIFDIHNVTVTYDFTNVIFHDGVQVTVDDLLASYYIQALHPNWYTDLACLMDNNGEPGSNFTTTHWLWIDTVYRSDDGIHAKLNFKLQKDFAMFYRSTLSGVLFPKHIWEGTGGDIHEDFGELLDPKGHGVPAADGGFDINKALAWDITDDSHVIGNGPFKFKEWNPGQYAKIVKYDEHFYMKPNIDGILFKIYKTTDAAVMALKGGDVDYVAWSIPPDYIPDLMGVENIGLSSAAEPGFFYLAFNMRKKDFGYDIEHNDVGKEFRKAVAHCVDKKTIVTTLLQNFGMIADGPVSPANTLWFNDSLPTYPPDVEKAKDILDNAGIIDSDGDGWRELPTIGDARFEILTPPADYDPIRSAAGLMIATQMQAAGINVVSKPTAFGEIVRLIDARQFDMYILGWSIGGTDPDYLYSFFYSGNAEAGQNYPGYADEEFDRAILDSRAEMNETKRVELIKECQGILAEDLPYDVLYYRQNIEAYRADRFTNWTLDSSGSLYNYWSRMGIKPPSTHWLRSTASTTSAVISEGTAKVVVTIKDQDQNPVEGATVYLEIENPANSTLTGTISLPNNKTNVNGQVIAKYTAPYIPQGTEDQTVLIYVRKNNETWGATYTSPDGTKYDHAEASLTAIVVKPGGSKFLALAVTAEYDIVESSGMTTLSIAVTDQDSTYLTPSLVDNAVVNISVQSPASVEPSYGTTVSGAMGGITFTAPTVSVDTSFEVTIEATKTGYDSAVQTLKIDVLRPHIDEPPIPAPSILLLIAAIAVGTIAYNQFRRRK